MRKVDFFIGYEMEVHYDYDNMPKHVGKCVSRECSNCLYSKGQDYDDKKDYDNMVKYYAMAAEKR